MNDDNVLEMKVEGLTLDPLSHVPIILLKEVTGDRVLPIWVGIFEANAIALEIEKVGTPRPMTHDLIKNIFDSIEVKVDNISITELKDSTFYAAIVCRLKENLFNIDARPSDAIAVALRMGVPIYVMETVVDAAKSIEIPNVESEINDKEKWKSWIDNVKPEDFDN